MPAKFRCTLLHIKKASGNFTELITTTTRTTSGFLGPTFRVQKYGINFGSTLQWWQSKYVHHLPKILGVTATVTVCKKSRWKWCPLQVVRQRITTLSCQWRRVGDWDKTAERLLLSVSKWEAEHQHLSEESTDITDVFHDYWNTCWNTSFLWSIGLPI